MKTTPALLVLALLSCAVTLSADGPVASSDGKLFGMTLVTGSPDGDDWGPGEDVLYPLYEQSGATVVMVNVGWGDAEPADPGAGTSTYDFSRFDNQLFMKSAKTKVCWIGLGNAWADKIKAADPVRYWKLAEAFVTAAAKHANSKGIRYFAVPGNEFDLLGRADWAQLYVEPMKHIYAAVKAASKDNLVMAGNLSNGLDNTVQAFYDAGAKGHFDILNIHTYSNHPRTGVDIFQVVAAHRAMVRNGDGDKLIFLGEGWGPGRSVPGISRKSHEEAPTEAEINAMRSFVENGYRNMLTERDIYDPKWLLGAQFFTMNDNYGQRQWKKRVKYVDENGDGKPDYIMLDGYKFPPDFGIEPAFFNGGLVGFDGKPKGDLLDSFLPDIPRHSLDARIAGDGPIFNYVTEQPYKYIITFTNHTNEEIALERFGVNWKADRDFTIDAQLEGDAPKTVPAGGSATATFSIKFPSRAAGQQFTLIGECDYAIGGRKHSTDCWTTVLATSQLEVTLLPGRVVMDPNETTKRVGMSVINHTESPFEGAIKFTGSPGITVTPAETAAKIDSFGLEAYVFSIAADAGLAPGHHTVHIDIGGRAKDWVAVEVPALAAKMSPKLDGSLDEWKSVAAFDLAKPKDGGGYEFIGKGRFAHDAKGFYAAFEVDDTKHVQSREPGDLWQEDSIQIALDPLMNGARGQGGGYREDDYEYTFAFANGAPVVYRFKGTEWKPAGEVKEPTLAFRRDGNRSVYEISLPWSEVVVPASNDPGSKSQRAFDPAKDTKLAVSVLVNRNDGSGRSCVEWGGGIAETKEPRLFVPVILLGD